MKYVPTDETINLFLVDQTTVDWNPLIFAIFYQKVEVVEYFCESPHVYVRSCLTTPFLVETEEDAAGFDDDSEEKFIKEKSEIFPLVMCMMLNNRDIFRYLWKTCSFIWNDVHLILLSNFIFDSQWQDGVKILFASA